MNSIRRKIGSVNSPKRFIALTEEIMSLDISLAAQRVLAYIVRQEARGRSQYCWIKSVADDTFLSYRTARRAVDQLKNRGFVDVVKDGRKSILRTSESIEIVSPSECRVARDCGQDGSSTADKSASLLRTEWPRECGQSGLLPRSYLEVTQSKPRSARVRDDVFCDRKNRLSPSRPIDGKSSLSQVSVREPSEIISAEVGSVTAYELAKMLSSFAKARGIDLPDAPTNPTDEKRFLYAAREICRVCSERRWSGKAIWEVAEAYVDGSKADWLVEPGCITKLANNFERLALHLGGAG